MSSWDADLYLRFGEERTRPAVDLASRIDVSEPDAIIDLGCGPGNSTQVLRGRWPRARVWGLDSSPDMIAAARRDYPEQGWILANVDGWSAGEPFDIVFSNAALQWIRNHDRLVPHLFDQVAPGGALAFQIPSVGYSKLRAFIREIADDAAWRARMHRAKASLTMEEPFVYYDALADWARLIDIWETDYNHVMDDSRSIVEWISGTGLRPFLEALDSESERGRFVELLLERVTEAYPRRIDGKVLFPFRRLFVVAYK